ncbi:unnamed protein product [Cochlearia groenlandica]
MGMANTLGMSYDALYGFTIQGIHDLANGPGDSVQLWKFLANGVFEPGRSKNSTPKLRIGGWVTPLLKLMRVPLRGKLENKKFMDIPYLGKAVILVGELKGIYGYSFKYEGTPRIIIFPNKEFTSFEYNDMINFQPLSRFFHDLIQKPLTPIRRPRKNVRPAGPRGHKHEAIICTIYGSERYYTCPSSAQQQPGSLQDMYVEMRTMTHWNKFQDRVIRMLVNDVKSLKKAMSEEHLARIVARAKTCKWW